MTLNINVLLKDGAKLPIRKTVGSAGMDLFSVENKILKPFTVSLVNTGICLELPINTHAEVRARSSMAVSGILLANGVGTIDSDFRGVIKVMLYNSTKSEYILNKGDRIAQLIFASYLNVDLVSVNAINDTSRGNSGFGSTGK